LSTDGDKQLRVRLGHADVVVNHRDCGENVVEKGRTNDSRPSFRQLDADSELSNGDRRDGDVVVVIERLVDFPSGPLDVDEKRGVEQKPSQLRSSMVNRSRSPANSVRQLESTLWRRSIAFTSEPRPLGIGSIKAIALPRRTIVILSPRCSTASRRSANLRAASVALISVI